MTTDFGLFRMIRSNDVSLSLRRTRVLTTKFGSSTLYLTAVFVEAE